MRMPDVELFFFLVLISGTVILNQQPDTASQVVAKETGTIAAGLDSSEASILFTDSESEIPITDSISDGIPGEDAGSLSLASAEGSKKLKPIQVNATGPGRVERVSLVQPPAVISKDAQKSDTGNAIIRNPTEELVVASESPVLAGSDAALVELSKKTVKTASLLQNRPAKTIGAPSAAPPVTVTKSTSGIQAVKFTDKNEVQASSAVGSPPRKNAIAMLHPQIADHDSGIQSGSDIPAPRTQPVTEFPQISEASAPEESAGITKCVGKNFVIRRCWRIRRYKCK